MMFSDEARVYVFHIICIEYAFRETERLESSNDIPTNSIYHSGVPGHTNAMEL